MSEETNETQVVYWPRVKEIMDGIMARWIERWGRQPLPGIHTFYWETSQEIKEAVLSGLRAIEPGLPARQTNLVKSLARAVGTSGRMPLRGPFMATTDIEEKGAGSDGGRPEGRGG